MAANYKVNIELDTKKLDAQLKDLGVKVDAVGKVRGTRSKQALTDAEKELKAQIKSLNIENRALGVEIQSSKVKSKNIKFKETELLLANAKKKAQAGEFDLATKEVALARRNVLETKKALTTEIKVTKQKAKQVRLSRQIASPIGGSRYMPGSPGQLGYSGGPSVPISGSRYMMGSPSQLAYSGGPSSPIGGSKSIPGSPAYLANIASQTRSFNMGSAISSATISGAFPLLFGQGPVSALGGAIGGGLGGGLGGQMGGFAGGLAGTTIATGISQLAGSIANLGKAFNSITPDIDALTGALGVSGTEEERRLKLIQKQQGVQAALSAVTDELNKAVGEEGVKNLKQFGETSRLLGNQFTLLMTRMQAALAPLFELVATPLSGPARAKEQSRLALIGGANTDPIITEARSSLEASKNRPHRGGRGGAKAKERFQASMSKIIEEREKELALLGKGIERRNNLRMIETDLSLKVVQQNELLQARIDGNYEEVKLAQEVNEEVQRRLDAGFGIMEINRKDIENQLVTNNNLKEQAEIVEEIEESYKKMKETIVTDIGEGIKGLIKGTSTLSDVLNSVADKLLDVGLNLALYGNPGGSFTKGSGFLGSIFRASGGPVTGGSPYIVGEKGPELFVPGASGNIVPNHEMGGSNVVVNVDASGSSVEGDAEKGQELGTMLGAAIQAALIKEKRPGGILG